MNLSEEAFYNGFSLNDIQKYLIYKTNDISVQKSIVNSGEFLENNLKILRDKNEVYFICLKYTNDIDVNSRGITVFFTEDVKINENQVDEQVIKLSMHIDIFHNGLSVNLIFSNLSNEDHHNLESFWEKLKIEQHDKSIDLLWLNNGEDY